ncbi:uncharacterized protein IL334_004916 [Kwoniella shivajii]|uniref:Zn(2)-C6 fungal-type domain-containing protein n=1 Tax=Kwoniella shivajii TaxID=564305 RepID=A0ABZ1D1P8_9TREE|nr:hypothetical protein IL334_004916 [Kwoniella shivajii]
MKIPSDRRSSDASYAPYSVTSPRSFQQPALPNRTTGNKKSNVPQLEVKTEEQPQYKVARAISSCTRCRSRKQKCDGKLPACSACERAKVECIGFDAISKTNISRNYLHSLEQEVASLRAQVAALQSSDTIGQTKKQIATNASQAVSSFRSDFPLDPALMNEDGNSSTLQSPLESPNISNQSFQQYGQGHGHSGHHRRHSDYPYPSTPLTSDPPRSPFFNTRPHPTGQAAGIQSTSLTRMVHDAAYRTGHAVNSASSLNPAGSATGSDKGSSIHGTDSPVTQNTEVGNYSSPENVLTPKSGIAIPGPPRRPPSASPLATPANLLSSSGGSNSKSKRRPFAIPPLPPQPAVERLVAAYVDFVGVTGPIIHIPSLGKQLMKIRDGVDVEEGDVFVVMMVLALSTMASSRFVDPPDELRACSEAFHAEAMKHLDAVFEEQSYIGLQAILLLVWYSLLNPDKGSIWFLVGLATRTCVDLGYHNEHNTQVDQIDSLELDMRRRLFWCTYKMDRLLSQSLGRPPSIPDGFINVPLPSPMHDIDIHPNHYGPLEGEPCSYKAVFLHTTKMRQLQSEILFNTYGIHGSTGRIPSEEWRQDCFERLKTWLAEAPEPRGTVSTEGYAISFHNSCLLLFRPSPGCPRPGRSALSTVLTSSSYVIRIYRRMQINNRISWLWMTSHFSFMAGLSFLYAYFNLYSMGGGKDVPSIEDALMVIDSCLNVLDFLAPRVPSASGCHETMQSVSQAIFEQLSKLDPPPTMSSSADSPGRGISRGVPISSSREDPLPNESFPAPLPAIALPYELSLLDNLFRNPMASHNKASEYTSNQKCRNKKKKAQDQQVNVDYGGIGNYRQSSGSNSNHNNNKGYPPGAFHTQSNSKADEVRRVYGGNRTDSDVEGYTTESLLGPYTLAMGLGSTQSAGFNNGNIDNTNQAQNHNQNQNQNGGNDHQQPTFTNSQQPSSSTISSSSRELPMLNGSNGVEDQNGFDLFSFLMDEEGLGGNGFTALDVPADFSLWS